MSGQRAWSGLTGGEHLLLPHLLLLEEVLEERLVAGAHFGLQACRRQGNGAQQVAGQPVFDLCRPVLQAHGSLGKDTKDRHEGIFREGGAKCSFSVQCVIYGLN